MLYTTYKKGIETFKERHPSVFWKDAIHCSCFGEDKENNIPELPDDIKQFLKSLAIKSNEEMITWIENINDSGGGNGKRLKLQIISHLETQNKLIEEDKNI